MFCPGFQAGHGEIGTVSHLLSAAKGCQEQLQVICQATVAPFDTACCRVWTINPADQCGAPGCVHALSGLCQYRESCLHLLSWAGPDEVFRHLPTRLPLGCPDIAPLAVGGEEACLRNDWGGVPEEARQLGICSFAGYRLSDSDGQLRGVMTVFADQAISQTEHDTFAGFATFASRIIQVADLEKKLAQEVAERKRLERNLGHVCQVLAQSVTSNRQYEQQLRPAMKHAHIMEAAALMAGGLAHDLNNILTGLITYPDLLLAQLPAGSPLQRGLELIRESSLRAVAMTDDLLAMSRGMGSPGETAQLNELVQQHLALPEHQLLAAAHPEISFEQCFDPQLHAVKCPPGQLREIVKELLRNTVAVLQGSHKVVISTTSRHLDGALPGYEVILPGSYAVLSVAGHGQPLAPQDLDRLFEPFYAKRVMGRHCNGLGLAKVWNLVHKLGGSIDVISTSHETRFDLYFQAAGEKGVGLRPHDPGPLAGQGETILVVDDEPGQREAIDQLLSNLNYRGNTVASGEEAIALLEKQPFDLVILDMVMPGLSGLETYERMQLIRPGLRTIMASGYAATVEINRALQLGVEAFIRKPCSLQQLGEAIKQALQRKSTPMGDWKGSPVH